MFFLPFYGDSGRSPVTEWYTPGKFHLLIAEAGAVAILALVAVFFYKNRTRQVRLCRAGMIVSLMFFSHAVVFPQWFFHSIPVEHIVLGAGAWLLLLNPVFFFLAARFIKKDEELVRAADRLR